MQDLSHQPLSPVLVLMIGLVGGACLAVWAHVVLWWRRGVPVLPYEPRRGVPWRGIDLFSVLLVYLAGQIGMFLSARLVLGAEATEPPMIRNVEQPDASHAVARVLAGGDIWTLLLCGLTAAIVAPIVEEFLFRVLLQGYLEDIERRLRPQMPTLRRLVSRGTGPILLTSLLFARMHFRVDTPEMGMSFLLWLLIGNAVVGLLTVVFAVGLLRIHGRATAMDLGWSWDRFAGDVGLGLLAFVAVAVPIYLLQVTLSAIFPRYVAADPLTLLVFSVALGLLYFRTHRVVPSIVVHMALNITSLAMAWLLLGC